MHLRTLQKLVCATFSGVALRAKLKVMTLTNDISAFGNLCERLLASIATHRPLTEQEVLFIGHYCKELLHKISGVIKVCWATKQNDAGKSESGACQPRIEKSIGLKRPLFEPSAEQAVRPHTMSISARRSMWSPAFDMGTPTVTFPCGSILTFIKMLNVVEISHPVIPCSFSE